MIKTNLTRMIAALSLALSGSAMAQNNLGDIEKVVAETFRPALDREGIIDVESGDVRQNLDFDIALWGWYADDPLKIIAQNDTSNTLGRLVRHRAATSLTASLSLANWIQVGVELPIMIYQSGETFTGADKTSPTLDNWFGLSNIRIVPKLRILSQRGQGVNLALLGHVWLPFQYRDAQYVGEDTFKAAPMLALSKHHAGGFKWALNAGALLRFPNYDAIQATFGHDLDARIGLSYNLGPKTGVPLGFDISTRGQMQISPEVANIEEYEVNVESSAGIHYDVSRAFQLFVGGGLGILSGPGTPDWRVFGGLRFSPQRCADSDGDGICDDEDQCINEPGVRDSEDGVGCPGANDSDGDGIVDDEDECPETPGIRDSSEGVGCPQVEAEEAPVDEVPDTDGDGLLDPDDKCPQAPGPRMFEGCPDTDGDGFPDDKDQCPEEAEIINGNEDDDGCPDEGKSLVSLDKDHIEIKESVYFETNKAVIKQRSYNLLDQVAHILNAHPEIAKCRVEGHTDSRGGDQYNQDLSERRANAVREFLIEHGVESSRLTSEGYGETKPIASNKTKAGRQKNRRVDFYVTEYTDR